MPLLKERYKEWKESDEGKDIDSIQVDIETEILARLLSGKIQYKQAILNHTCKEMFTDKDLRAMYEIIIKYLQSHELKDLTPFNIMTWLDKKDVKYIHYFMYLKQVFTCSADVDNWLIRLHNLYEKRILTECKTIKEIQEAQENVNKYKLQERESKLFDVAIQYINDYDRKSDNIVKTNYPKIDELIGGFQGGNYIILAGATGMGKTAMAINLIMNIIKQKKKVLFISLEMTPGEILSRIISRELKIPSESIRNHTLSEQNLNKYVAYIDSKDFKELQENITIPATNDLSISKIEEIVRKSKAHVVFVDYLGLVKADNIRSSSYEQVSDISRRLKLLAMETDKPIVCLHQLNRANADRKDKRPLLSDLRDSGKIEQDADFITFVYRPCYYDPQTDNKYMEFIVGKSRHTSGANKVAQLNFEGYFQLITERTGQYAAFSNEEF